MKQTSRIAFAFLLLAGVANPAFAQKSEFETKYNENFLRRSPLIGTAPDIQLFDSLGRPFKIISGEEKYTVVVFGCLT